MQSFNSTPASTSTSEISIPDAIRQLRALDAAFADKSAAPAPSKSNLTDSLTKISIPDASLIDAEKQQPQPAPRPKVALRLRLAAALAALLPLWAGWTVFCFFYVQSTFTHPWPAPAFAACIALAAALPLLSTLAVCGALRIRVLPSQREPSASQQTCMASDADAAQRTAPASDADEVQQTRMASNDASQRETTGITDSEPETTGSNLKDSEPVYSFRKPALVFLLAAALALVPPLAVYGAFLARA